MKSLEIFEEIDYSDAMNEAYLANDNVLSIADAVNIATKISNKLLSERLKKVYLKVKEDDDSNFYHVGTTRILADTHVSYLVEPQPIEPEKVECDHILQSVQPFDDKGQYTTIAHAFCPKCGKPLGGEE